ncbi:MAG: phytanoyl-CoA dioxygenase family protein [Caldilineaceae bacterium]
MIVTQQQIQQYHEQGYCVLERVIPQETLDGLRAECSRFIEMMHAEMDAQGTDTLGISHRNRRYFVARRYQESPLVTGFLFSNLMAEVTSALLGPNVYLFHEQYVVKAAEKGYEVCLAPGFRLCGSQQWRAAQALSFLLVSAR